MDYNIFMRGMALLVKSFPEKDTDMDVMWEFLQDLESDDFMSAVSKIVMTNQEINRATNLIALIRDFAMPEDSSAGEAWSKVLGGISSVGSYGYPKFDDELIDRCVSCIGWRNMCMSENIAIERAHFFKVYETLSRRKRTEVLTVNHDVKKLITDIQQK